MQIISKGLKFTYNKKTEFLKEALGSLKSNNPQELANAILDAAMVRENYQPKDDMTVLVMGFWENKYE